jgi:hypothetical protein
MAILNRVVCPRDWDLTCLDDVERRRRLVDVPSPDAVLESVLSEASERARAGHASLEWEDSGEMPGHSRIRGQFPISRFTFDVFFNGRSGYRAQYYLSPEEGILFNRRVVEGLMEATRIAYDRSPLEVTLERIERSLFAPHAKVWVYREREAFDAAAVDTLNPPRWVENCASRGRRVPLPHHPCLDLKGAFLHQTTGKLFVGSLKVDRACDLHYKGYS